MADFFNFRTMVFYSAGMLKNCLIDVSFLIDFEVVFLLCPQGVRYSNCKPLLTFNVFVNCNFSFSGYFLQMTAVKSFGTTLKHEKQMFLIESDT